MKFLIKFCWPDEKLIWTTLTLEVASTPRLPADVALHNGKLELNGTLKLAKNTLEFENVFWQFYWNQSSWSLKQYNISDNIWRKQPQCIYWSARALTFHICPDQSKETFVDNENSNS